MKNEYERFIDADRNRIEWVPIIRMAEKLLYELESYSPSTAKKLRTRFYEVAEQPLATAASGQDFVEYIEANLEELGPIPWEDAVRCAAEIGSSAWAVIDEHRLWALEQT